MGEQTASAEPRPAAPEAQRRVTVQGISLGQTFAALKFRNYRLWFIGQLVSLVGTWMQATAQGFLIFQLTQSPAYLGYVGFAAGVPSWIFMLYGGVIADRISRRTLLIITQSTMMVLAFILAGLTFANLVQPWHIVVLALLLGLANAFDAPARQAFVLEMVDRETMPNAIALNGTMFNSATAVGPAVAGITYALFGPAWCFTLNGLSFIAVIIALALMHIAPQALPLRRQTSALVDLKEGLHYSLSHPVIGILLVVVMVISLVGMAYATLIPDWAVKILGGDATTNGYLQSARGLGSVIGALIIASRGSSHAKGRLLTMGSFAFPIFLIVFGLMRWLPLSLLALLGVGLGFMFLFNMANVLIQTHVSDELRGRVMAIYSLTFFGLIPVGALAAGATAAAIGETATVLLSAGIALAFAVGLWLFVPRLRSLD